MELQSEISSFFNDSGFLGWGDQEKILRRNISKITGRDFSDFENSYTSYYKDRKVKKKKIIRDIPLMGNKDLEGDFLRPLREFRKFILNNFSNKEIVGVYIHGSLATGDYIENYSDFDALIILKKEIFKSDRKIRKIRKLIRKANTFLYLLDPLQHHELFIISEFDLENYFDTIFPSELFKYSKRITPYGSNLSFRCLDDFECMKKGFILRKDFFFHPKKSEFDKRRTYHLKNFIQNVLLFPSIYYEIKYSKSIYKKFSFEKIKKDFTYNEWKIVERCTQVRNSCSYKSFYSYPLRKFIGLTFHYKFLKLLHRYFDRDNSGCILKILGKDYLGRAKKLILKMEKNLKEDGKI